MKNLQKLKNIKLQFQIHNNNKLSIPYAYRIPYTTHIQHRSTVPPFTIHIVFSLKPEPFFHSFFILNIYDDNSINWKNKTHRIQKLFSI